MATNQNAEAPAEGSSAPIWGVVAKWHDFLRGDLPGGLDDLLDDDVVFFSPIVFTPQEGKEVTSMYLTAATHALPGDVSGEGDGDAASAAKDGGERWDGRFRYSKQVLAGDTAVLEFETTVEGKYVNGVDIIRCNDAGRIVEFRVMVRPLQAVELVHAQMRSMLEALGGA